MFMVFSPSDTMGHDGGNPTYENKLYQDKLLLSIKGYPCINFLCRQKMHIPTFIQGGENCLVSSQLCQGSTHPFQRIWKSHVKKFPL